MQDFFFRLDISFNSRGRGLPLFVLESLRMFHSGTVLNLSTINLNTEKGTRTRSRNIFCDVVPSTEESWSSNIFSDGESQILATILGFLACSSFFLLVFDVGADFLP